MYGMFFVLNIVSVEIKQLVFSIELFHISSSYSPLYGIVIDLTY